MDISSEFLARKGKFRLRSMKIIWELLMRCLVRGYVVVFIVMRK
jgi:hypothetical protein